MIYPTFRKAEITEWIGFCPSSVEINGFECAYAQRLFFDSSVLQSKGNKLYIEIAKENTRQTEYIVESRRLSGEKYFYYASLSGEKLQIKLTVSGKAGLFRAINRIIAMCRDAEFPIGEVEDYPLFAVRGYIEGFYGKPWSRENRIDMLKLMSFYGMNTYYYAPKDDPYHRDKWDQLYPACELRQITELCEVCEKNFMDFHYCIAPGLSMRYSSEEDFEKLCCKAHQLYACGVRNFGLLLDDIPENLFYIQDREKFDYQAVNAHIYLVNRFYDYLKELNSECVLTVCPLQYHGNADEYYISKLGSGIPGGVGLFWTGSNICSQKLTVRESVIFEKSTNRLPLFWDNYPVNDAEMQNEMHLGYLSGREAELFRYCDGLIANAMEYCLSSKTPLLTICDYLWNPLEYNGVDSWHKACKIVLGSQKDDLMPFLDNLLTSCLKVENSPMLNKALERVQQLLFAGDISGASGALNEYKFGLEKCCNILRRGGDEMLKELEPWAEKQFIALDIIRSASDIFADNSSENKERLEIALKRYKANPKTLCDFSLQCFAERMLAYE